MTWGVTTETLDQGRLLRVGVLRAGTAASYRETISAWADDAALLDAFTALLAEAPYAAFFWETPPVTDATADRAFEFILRDAPALARMTPEPAAFAREIAGRRAAAFPNLGGDALLVAPGPSGDYPHLAAFARSAPRNLQHAFWGCVGESVAAHLSARPLWVSTSGLGVAWLHVRLDTRPKYYTHAPYRAYRAGGEEL